MADTFSWAGFLDKLTDKRDLIAFTLCSSVSALVLILGPYSYDLDHVWVAAGFAGLCGIGVIRGGGELVTARRRRRFRAKVERDITEWADGRDLLLVGDSVLFSIPEGSVHRENLSAHLRLGKAGQCDPHDLARVIVECAYNGAGIDLLDSLRGKAIPQLPVR